MGINSSHYYNPLLNDSFKEMKAYSSRESLDKFEDDEDYDNILIENKKNENKNNKIKKGKLIKIY